MKWEPISLFTLRRVIYTLNHETFIFLLSFLKTGSSEETVVQMLLFLFNIQDLEDFADKKGFKELIDEQSPENPSPHVLCLSLVRQARKRYRW